MSVASLRAKLKELRQENETLRNRYVEAEVNLKQSAIAVKSFHQVCPFLSASKRVAVTWSGRGGARVPWGQPS